MAKYSLPHFEELDSEDLEEYYNATIGLNGNNIQVDLNFEEPDIDIKRLDIAKQFIENIAEYDKKNKQYIEHDFADKKSDSVREYLEVHLAEVGKEKLTGIIKFDDETTSPELQMMNALYLKRMGLYPSEKNHFAIFDYTIGSELTQYLVVIYTNENGELDSVAMES